MNNLLQNIPISYITSSTEFQSTVQVGDENITLKFNVRWNEFAGYWNLTITSMSTGEILLDSIPMVTGEGILTIDLLRKHEHLEIGRAYLVEAVDHPESEYPGETNMNEFALVWGNNS